MKKILIYLALIGVLSTGFYYLTLFFIPNAIYMIAAMRLKKQQNAEVNELIYTALPRDEARAVVMPNPDFMYALSFYDVSEQPLRLSGNMPDSTYWSVAFYQPNTINWYIKNDMQYGTDQLDLIIVKEGTSITDATTEIAHSPLDKGMLLIRILVTDDSPEIVAKYEALQHTIQLQTFDE